MKITLSALGPSIEDQCKEAGLVPTGMSFNLIERIHYGITLARIHGVLTDAECTRARQRLLKRAKFVEREKND